MNVHTSIMPNRIQQEGAAMRNWKPDRTGDFDKDAASGRAKFVRLQTLMQSTGNTLLLSRTLRAMVEGGEWEAVEIGFSQAMSEALM